MVLSVKRMNNPLTNLLLKWPIFLCCLAYTVSADVADIMEQSARQRLADLTAYTEAHPGAEDLDEAYAALIDSYRELGREEEALGVMIQSYAWARQQADSGLDTIFGEHVRPTAEALAAAGYRKRGADFMLQVRKNYRRHPAYAQLSPIMDQLDGLFKGIGVGDAPAVSFVDLLSKKHRLKDYAGNVVLLDFWSYSENQNLRLIPALQATYQAHANDGFVIISISEDNSPLGLDQYLRKAEMPWIHVHDKQPGNQVAEKLGITSTPKNFLFDQEGNIVGMNVYGIALKRQVSLLLAK